MRNKLNKTEKTKIKKLMKDDDSKKLFDYLDKLIWNYFYEGMRIGEEQCEYDSYEAMEMEEGLEKMEEKNDELKKEIKKLKKENKAFKVKIETDVDYISAINDNKKLKDEIKQLKKIVSKFNKIKRFFK